MSDPKYNVYAGELRFDDDNIVDINLEPDTENITVRLNGEEITGGSGLPAVTSDDNGDVLTVVEGVWAKADPPTELPAVSGADNGNVLTVVEGSWAKAAPADEIVYIPVEASWDDTYDEWLGTSTYTTAQVLALASAGKRMVVALTFEQDPLDPGDDITNYVPLFSINATSGAATFTAVQFGNGSWNVMMVEFGTGGSGDTIYLDFREITLN